MTTSTAVAVPAARSPVSTPPVDPATPAPTPAPVERLAAWGRLIGVDATRGVALLGMMTIHSLPLETAAGHPTWTFEIFAGRAAAAFAVLAGVGIAFMTGRRRVGRADARGAVAALLTRALAIGAIGLALGYTDAALAAVILPYYAVMFLLVIPLVFLPTWALALVAPALVLGLPALSHLARPHLPVAAGDNPTLSYLIHAPLQLLYELTITGEYPAMTWLAYLCAGLLIGRLNLARIWTGVALLLSGVVFAVGAAVASWQLLHHYNALAHILATPTDPAPEAPDAADLLAFGADGVTPTNTWWWLAVDAPHTGTPAEFFGAIGTAMALLGLMLLAARVAWPVLRRPIAFIQAPLAAAGGMTLTFYTLHIMFINSEYDRYGATTGYLLQAGAMLLLGLGWRATAGRGPLEGLVAFLAGRARRGAAATRRRTRPPAQPEERTGTQPAIQPAAQPATQSATQSATQFETQSSAQPGTRPGRRSRSRVRIPSRAPARARFRSRVRARLRARSRPAPAPPPDGEVRPAGSVVL